MQGLEFCARSDTGRVRTRNEDALAVDSAAQLAILADGMGGYKAGEVASAMAAAIIHGEMARWLAQAAGASAGAANPGACATAPAATSADVRRALEACVAHANRAILATALADPDCAGMGTTLVAAVFHRTRLVLGHIGDSRCYRLRAGALLQLTHDHSWLQEQIDARQLTPEQAVGSISRNLLTRALGVEPQVLLEVNEFDLAGGDLYLLCSDGLTDMVDDAEIARLLRAPLALAAKAQALIDLANAHGGRDNVSVLLAQAGCTGCADPPGAC